MWPPIDIIPCPDIPVGPDGLPRGIPTLEGQSSNGLAAKMVSFGPIGGGAKSRLEMGVDVRRLFFGFPPEGGLKLLAIMFEEVSWRQESWSQSNKNILE